MISNACATMRTDKSFLPLLRPFIIKLSCVHLFMLFSYNGEKEEHTCQPIAQR